MLWPFCLAVLSMALGAVDVDGAEANGPLRRGGTDRAAVAARSAGRPAPQRLARVGDSSSRLAAGKAPTILPRRRAKGRPLSFQPNGGRFPAEVRYFARGEGYALFLAPKEAVLVFASGRPVARSSPASGEDDVGCDGEGAAADPPWRVSSVVRLSFPGARSDLVPEGQDPLPGRLNCYFGNDPSQWRTALSTFSRIRYPDIYPGIDLVFRGEEGALEYDFVLKPGADPSRIDLALDVRGRVGGAGPSLDAGGDLHMPGGADAPVFKRPVLFQQHGAGRTFVDGHWFVKKNGHLGFRVGRYDPCLPLVVDPVLEYSTYLGGTVYDEAKGIVVDDSGQAVVAGYTWSPTFPGPAGPVLNHGSADVFVTKLSGDGGAIVWTTLLGGTSTDEGFALARDAAGHLFITGVTGSNSFPVLNGFQTGLGPGATQNGFISELNDSGALLYSSYLGGSSLDQGNGIGVAPDGTVLIAGQATSANFPLMNPLPGQNALHGGMSGFLARVDTAQAGAASLLFSTFLGGNNIDMATSLAADEAGNAYIGGLTNSADFPVVNAFQAALNGSDYDAFLTKVAFPDPDPPAIAYSTYLGGMNYEKGYSVAAGSNGMAFLGGATQSSSDFPLLNPTQATYGGGVNDGFVSAFDTTLSGASSLLFSTFVGGGNGDEVYGLLFVPPQTDAGGQPGGLFFGGSTYSTDLPATGTLSPSGLLAGASVSGRGGPEIGFESGYFGYYRSYGSPSVFWYLYSLLYYGTGAGNYVNALAFFRAYTYYYFLYYYYAGLSGPNGITTTPGAFQSTCGGDYTSTVAESTDCQIVCGSQVPPAGCVNENVQFSSSPRVGQDCQGSGTFTYDWDFGDGSFHANTPNPLHAYGLPGTYHWTLTVTWGDQSCTTRGDIVICSPSCSATATPASGQAPLNVDFTADATGCGDATVTYEWHFGDGASAQGSVASHTYTEAMDYIWTLTATFSNGCSCVSTGTIVVLPPPCTLDCTASASPETFCGPGTVAFTATATPSQDCTPSTVSFAWDFGDGGTSGQQNPTHVYPTPGVYAWQMTASYLDMTCTKSGTIHVCGLACSASAPAQGDTNHAVSFTSSADPSGECPDQVHYNWAFGDGAASTEQNPAHTYAADGTYTWTLDVTSNGCECSRSATITICTLTCSAAVPATACATANVSFAGTASCPGAQLSWTFGDGGTAAGGNPQHAYALGGNYTWTLTATLGGQTCTKSGVIAVCALTAAAFGPASACPNVPLNFTSTVSCPGSTYAWAFGDGGASNAANPLHAYAAPGRYAWTLVVSYGGCTANLNGVIDICGLTCSAIIPATGIAGTAVHFQSNAVVTFCADVPTFAWDFGDGATSNQASPDHIYASPGHYQVKLIITSACDACQQTKWIDISPPVLTLLKKKGNPFRIVVQGSNFQPGIRVLINGVEWTNVKYKNTTKIVLKGGRSLKTLVPKNTPTHFTFINPDGGQAETTWQWP